MTAAAAALLILAGCAAAPRSEFGTAESGVAVIVTGGVDVVPGTYHADYPGGDDCYWVMTGPDGVRVDGTARTVVLVAGETITTGGCGPWTREDD